MARFSDRHVSSIAPGWKNGLGFAEHASPGAAVVVTYDLHNRGLWDAGRVRDSLADGYRAFTPAEQRMARKAIEAYEAASGLRFVEVDGPADINFGAFSTGSLLGWGSYPRGVEGSVALREARKIGPGSEWFYVLLHELGHAVGLRHPFEGIKLPPRLDKPQVTVMTYADADGPWPARLGPLDVKALRLAYGDPAELDVKTARAGKVLKIAGGEDDDVIAARDGPSDGPRQWLRGRGGDDRLTAADKGDRLYGGAGDDRLNQRHAGRGVTDGGLGDDRLFAGNGAELARMFGGAGDDRIEGMGRGGRIWGGGGDDDLRGAALGRVWGGAGDDEASGGRVWGGHGDDALSGGRLWGGVGDDLLWPGAGARARGGGGDDVVRMTYWGGSSDGDVKRAWGEAGRDLFYAGHAKVEDPLPRDAAEIDALVKRLMRAKHDLDGGVDGQPYGGAVRLFGGAEDDVFLLNGPIRGEVALGGGDDRLEATRLSADVAAGAGDDALRFATYDGPGRVFEEWVPWRLRGEGAGPEIALGPGDDRAEATLHDGGALIYGGGGDDVVDVTSRFRTSLVEGGRGADRLIGGPAADLFYGGAGRDTLEGRDGRDVLTGGADDDALFGGAGPDVLIGGGGRDVMTGGAGRDVFVFGTGHARAGDPDVIEDFTPGEDRLRFATQHMRDGARVDASEDGALVLFGPSEGGAVLLRGVDAAEVTRAHFGWTGRVAVGPGLIEGGDGDDALHARYDRDAKTGPTQPVWLGGGHGDDVLTTESASARMRGGSGADLFHINPRAGGTYEIVDFDTDEDSLSLAAGDVAGTRRAGGGLVLELKRGIALGENAEIALLGLRPSDFDDIAFV